nr:fructose-1,6-bisphosphate aldolase/phosphatase [uncultured Actinotalea sp.]
MRTLSIIKADTGGWVGHSSVHPDQEAVAGREIRHAIETGLLDDGHVASCGDDLALIMSHRQGADAQRIHSFAWDVFQKTTAVAQGLGLYGAGQDLLSDAFSGNLRGMGPGYAELEIGHERPSEPILCFLADKTEPGAWNYPLFRMFADPFTTAGLVIDQAMHDGFVFEVYDLYENASIELTCPADMYDLLMYIGAPSRYVVHSVRSVAKGIVAAATSTQRLSLIAGRYVGKDDPVMIVRAQSGLPAVGEVLEPFAFPYSVAGCMRGSHHAPLMPVSLDDAHPTRFDGPPRVVCLGFQMKDGELVGPRDMFADPSFDRARAQANEVMDYYRRHGPFEPHRLPLDDLEYTTMPALEERLASRWAPLTAADVHTPEGVRAAKARAREQAVALGTTSPTPPTTAPTTPPTKEASGH